MDSLEYDDDIANISDMDSCMSYLREASLYKMMNDPNHRAMLFLLEVLMNSERSMSIDELASRFFSDMVSTDMQDICGTSAAGLRAFLEKYPSLFRLDQDMVSSVDVVDHGREEDILNGNEFDIKPETPRLRRPADLTVETEAVKYFQGQLAKKEERWVPIKSLAGHLSQASDGIRRTVGSQSYFRSFLQRHPHVFELQGDLVSLKDQFPVLCLSKGVRLRPKSTVINPKKSARTSRPSSMVVNPSQVHQDSAVTSAASMTSLAIDSREFQAAMFLRAVIRRRPRGKIGVSHLFLYLAKAPQAVRDCIGWTKVELQEFLRKQPSLFDIDPSGHITCSSAEEISVVVNDTPLGGKEGMRTIINHKGSVYHVSKLWGIIDLGEHEHVFFDKSIFRHLDDLQRHFKVGEQLYFNAILAPKQSRAKWRATQVWKESDKDMVQRFCGDILSAPFASAHDLSVTDADSASLCRSLLSEQRLILDSYHDVDEELAEILQLSKIDSDDESANWEAATHRRPMEVDDFSIASIPSPSPSSADGVSSFSNLQGGSNPETSVHSGCHCAEGGCRRGPPMVSVATQTISTGEIMAIHMYHEVDPLPPGPSLPSMPR